MPKAILGRTRSPSRAASLSILAVRVASSAYSTLAVLLIVFAQPAYAETFEGPVVRVIDGDSLIVLRDREQVRVRLKEIDAPERNQRFGKRSRQSLSDMCAKKRARVSWTERDRNGRTLGRVWCSGIDANAEQVRRGLAWVFDRLRQRPEPVPVTGRCEIRPARTLGRRRADCSLGLASSERATGIPGEEVGPSSPGPAASRRAGGVERQGTSVASGFFTFRPCGA